MNECCTNATICQAVRIIIGWWAATGDPLARSRSVERNAGVVEGGRRVGVAGELLLCRDRAG